jgi:hypothetical protein
MAACAEGVALEFGHFLQANAEGVAHLSLVLPRNEATPVILESPATQTSMPEASKPVAGASSEERG